MHKANRPVQILSIEDNPADIQLLQHFFSSLETPCELTFIQDGQDAIDYLEKRVREKERLPNLILMDLNVPRKKGREILEFLKRGEPLRGIPVIVLTTSINERDVFEMYDRSANAFVSKPMDLRDFERLVKGIELFWFRVCLLPSLNTP